VRCSAGAFAALLCRERSVIVNMEHCHIIITASDVLAPAAAAAADPAAAAFVGELARRLAAQAAGAPELPPAAAAAAHFARSASEPDLRGGAAPSAQNGNGNGNGSGGADACAAPPLPFELRVLDAALEAVCARLDGAAACVESDTPPALAALTRRVSTATLEWVRRIKGRLSRLQARVASVRAEVERFLDDDADMRGLYLTRRAAEAAAAAAAAHAPAPAEPAAEEEADVHEAEDLLETVFSRLDTLRVRLATLAESIDATEDYLTFALDALRNQLIALELLLGAASFALSVAACVAGFFGMNLSSHLEDRPGAWVWVTAASAGGGVATFAALLWVMRRRGLLQGAGG
jgi:hypothetical protein